MSRSVVLLSGGHHSAAALMLAMGSSEVVRAIHIATDTRSAEGFHAARRIANALGVPCTLIPAHVYGKGIIGDMLRQASGIAATDGADEVWLGLWEGGEDAAKLLEGIQASEREAKANPNLTFKTPLFATVADLPFGIGSNLGHLSTLATDTHSCDLPRRDAQPWGHGCGNCPGCVRRREGWEAFSAAHDLVT